MTILCAADFTRLEPGNPPPSQSNSWCVTDCRDWGRFISKRVYTMPIQIDIEVAVHRFYEHHDARPYDGVSFLWGHPDNPNDRNYNINLLKRDPAQAGGNRWQEEVAAHKYEGRSGYKQPVSWRLHDVRSFSIHLQNAPPVTDPRTQPSNRALMMWSDGVEWPGYTYRSTLSTGRILIRADRCLAQWRVHVREGATTMAKRISGSSRYHTAAAVSRTRFPHGAKVVYLCSGANFPDALAAAPMATDGPLLYTFRDELPGPTRNEIARLRPKEIVVLGGRGVVSDDVVEQATKAAG